MSVRQTNRRQNVQVQASAPGSDRNRRLLGEIERGRVPSKHHVGRGPVALLSDHQPETFGWRSLHVGFLMEQKYRVGVLLHVAGFADVPNLGQIVVDGLAIELGKQEYGDAQVAGHRTKPLNGFTDLKIPLGLCVFGPNQGQVVNHNQRRAVESADVPMPIVASMGFVRALAEPHPRRQRQ